MDLSRKTLDFSENIPIEIENQDSDRKSVSAGVLSPIFEEKRSFSVLQEKLLSYLFPNFPKEIANETCTYLKNVQTKTKFIQQHYYQCLIVIY